MYGSTIPGLLSIDATVYSAVRALHMSAMRGWSIEDVPEIQSSKEVREHAQASVSRPGHFRNESTAAVTHFAPAMNGYYFSKDGAVSLQMSFPSDRFVDRFMRGISWQFDAMRGQAKTPHDATRLALWTSELTWLIHPFFAGHKRTTRPLFTYSLQKLGRDPIYLENASGSSAAFVQSAFRMMVGMYRRNIDVLPESIRRLADPVPDSAIVGVPREFEGDDAMKLVLEKQASYERLIAEHLEEVDMPCLRELIDDREVDRMVAHSGSEPRLPGVDHYLAQQARERGEVSLDLGRWLPELR